MPIYPCRCDCCGHYEEVFRSVSEHDNLPEHCGKKMRRVFTPMHVIEDMKPYRSPIDGSIVGSRKEHRVHMRNHGVIEVGNEKLKPPKKPEPPKGLRQELYNQLTRSGL